jgi:hypothetical protein
MEKVQYPRDFISFWRRLRSTEGLALRPCSRMTGFGCVLERQEKSLVGLPTSWNLRIASQIAGGMMSLVAGGAGTAKVGAARAARSQVMDFIFASRWRATGCA